MIKLDGIHVSTEIKKQIATEVLALKNNCKKIPHLAAVLVGDDGASETYVNAKVKDCAEVGFQSTLIRLPSTISENELITEINKLNNNDAIDGFIVQLPIPKHINEQIIIKTIAPNKDVDGFHPQSVGKMALNLHTFIPATPLGVLKLIEHYKIETAGKHCVVIGRSHIVGSPMSILMGRNAYPGNCTVTLTHSKTKNLKEICLTADIIIAALGKPEFLTADYVKQGAVVIDVGITRVKSDLTKSGYKLLGDVKYDEVSAKCSYITPVPGGVGPMTRAALLLNTLFAVKK
jgi:methylenetetrahydrofolate dehydrogenase (NADP+)/methenyltetrahydrofolate cyclohydrolase